MLVTIITFALSYTHTSSYLAVSQLLYWQHGPSVCLAFNLSVTALCESQVSLMIFTVFVTSYGANRQARDVTSPAHRMHLYSRDADRIQNQSICLCGLVIVV